MDMQGACAVKFRNVANLPFVKVKIEDKQFSGFIVDTGSNFTVIDQRLAVKLGLIEPPDPTRPQGGVSIYGVERVKAEATHIPSLSIGDCTAKMLAACVIDFSGSSVDFGARINGIIGQNFLKRYEVTIDYRSNLLILRPPNKGVACQRDTHHKTYFIPCRFAIPSPIRPIEPVLGLLAGILGLPPIIIADGRYDRTRLRFLIDTGAAAEVILSAGAIARMRLPANVKRVNIIGPIGSGIGGDVHGYFLRLPSLWLGNLEIPEPLVMVVPGMDVLSPYVDGIVGGDLFRDFIFTINYKRKVIRLVSTPPRRVRRTGGVGISLVRQDKRFFICSIVENSSAHKAGVKLHDEIVSINGQPLQGLVQARRLLRGKPGTSIKVVLVRDKKPIQLTLQRLEADQYT
jgi:predicted aspartyl protease